MAKTYLATLDANGKIPSSQLPSYVDDVLEYSSKASFPTTGEASKIYVDTTANLTYRWSGSNYVEISPSLALGETSSTAYRGDRGKEAYEHSQKTSGNPHGVTKSDVGLGNVPNVETNKQTPTYSDTTSFSTLSSGETISVAFAKIKLAITNLINHIGNKSNPHGVTKAQLGLGNVENKSSATIRGEITKSNVTTALGYTPLNQSLKGSASGLAELDSKGKVPSSQLPSFVDDVIEGYLSGGKFYKESAHTTEITGESGKIYIDLHTGKTYRWSGSTFGVISETLALGETSSTAYRGDRGKVAYDHSQTAHAPSNAQANVIETVKVNGTAITPSSKAVNITVPTNNNQLTNGAGYITSSGTAKTISDTLPISKGGTGQTTGENATNALINSLGEGTDTPSDNDYYISQYAGGGTTHRTYYRRPVSALWNYIKSKLSTVATSGSYNDLSNKPTIGNGTVTIKQAGTSKGTFTMNQSGNKTIELDNTWRGIQDNLTSTSTTDSLSAKQGKLLNEKMNNYAKGKGLEFSVVDGILTVTYDDGQ